MVDPAPTLTVPELAARVGIDPSTAYRYVAAGKLPGVKVGNRWVVEPARLERFLAGQEAADGTPLAPQRPEQPTPLAALPPHYSDGTAELLRLLRLLRAALDAAIGGVEAGGRSAGDAADRRVA